MIAFALCAVAVAVRPTAVLALVMPVLVVLSSTRGWRVVVPEALLFGYFILVPRIVVK